jgi:hypothetical protein
MKASNVVTALAAPIVAALGGAFMVYAGYDDSPGGSLIGLLLIVGALALNVRAARHRVLH